MAEQVGIVRVALTGLISGVIGTAIGVIVTALVMLGVETPWDRGQIVFAVAVSTFFGSAFAAGIVRRRQDPA